MEIDRSIDIDPNIYIYMFFILRCGKNESLFQGQEYNDYINKRHLN